MPLKQDHYASEQYKSVEKWAQVGIWGNIVLTILKLWAGLTAKSSAMIADSIHSASDILASFFVWVSLKIAKKPADERHPYGHHKAEVLSTLIVAILLALAGYSIISSAIEMIIEKRYGVPGVLALYAAIVSIVAKELMYRFTYRAGVKAHSPSTIANAMDHRSDAFSSIGTLVGIIFARIGFPIMDPIAGIAVALFILKMAYDVLRDAVAQIMDENPDPEKLAEATDLILSTEGVLDAHDIRIRQSGSVYFIELDIVVEATLTITQAHDIAEAVRYRLFNEMERIEEVKVHVDVS